MDSNEEFKTKFIYEVSSNLNLNFDEQKRVTDILSSILVDYEINKFDQFKGKNITKVVITIRRQDGGQSSSIALNIKTHNYKSRPSGKPSYVGTVGTLGLEVNTSRSKTITDKNNAIITGLKNGTIKGIGLQSTYDSSHYAVCSGSVTIKVTYSE